MNSDNVRAGLVAPKRLPPPHDHVEVPASLQVNEATYREHALRLAGSSFATVPRLYGESVALRHFGPAFAVCPGCRTLVPRQGGNAQGGGMALCECCGPQPLPRALTLPLPTCVPGAAA